MIRDDAEGQEVKQMMGTSLAGLRELSDAELVRRIDRLSESLQFLRSPDDYLNELQRRETMRQNQRLELLTSRLLWLTWTIAILTAVLVLIEVVGFFREG